MTVLLRYAALLCVVAPSAAVGADWYSCESELSSTSRAARDAEYLAAEMASLENELENLQSDYDRCISYPDVYDLFEDGCSRQRNDFNEKVEEYNSKLSELSAELDRFVRRAKNALSYCG